MSKYDSLFQPLQIGSITVKNRFAVAPMLIMGNHGPKGEISKSGISYYEERAKGGFGLIFTGAFMTDMEVDPFSPVEGMSPMYAPGHFIRSGLALNERMRAYDTKMFAQITMGTGRNSAGSYAPSEGIPTFADPTTNAPGLSKEQIKKKIEAVVKAAAVMKMAGFAGVEIHAMHWGYLLDQFAMSLTNKRTDEYGGALENRMRVAMEIVQGVKYACGADYPVSMRLGMKSYIKGFNKASLFGEDEAGRTLEEGVEIAKLLESFGYDLLNVDAGVYDSFYYAAAPMYMPKGYAIELSAAAKAAVKIPVICGSRMDDPDMCAQAMADGKIDGVVLGRASLADPHYPSKVERGKPEQIRPCIACNQGCIGRLLLGYDGSCAVNPQATRESYFGVEKALLPKKVAVIGGGIAGMEFARTAKLRGHDVTLYEKTDALGGNVIPGGKHEFKDDMNRLNQWYQLQLKDLGIAVEMNSPMDEDKIKKLGVDAVVLSVGSSPITPDLPGMDSPKVVSNIDALLGKKQLGEKIVVVGGGLVGCETAYDLAKQGKQVTIVEALPAILSAGEPTPLMNTMMIYDLLAHYKVNVVTGHKLAAVNDKGAVVSPAEGDDMEIEADTVILAVGYRSLPSMAEKLRGSGLEVYQIGDGNKVGNVLTSITDAYVVARKI